MTLKLLLLLVNVVVSGCGAWAGSRGLSVLLNSGWIAGCWLAVVDEIGVENVEGGVVLYTVEFVSRGFEVAGYCC